jgi:hypothetical protein
MTTTPDFFTARDVRSLSRSLADELETGKRANIRRGLFEYVVEKRRAAGLRAVAEVNREIARIEKEAA